MHFRSVRSVLLRWWGTPAFAGTSVFSSWWAAASWTMATWSWGLEFKRNYFSISFLQKNSEFYRSFVLSNVTGSIVFIVALSYCSYLKNNFQGNAVQTKQKNLLTTRTIRTTNVKAFILTTCSHFKIAAFLYDVRCNKITDEAARYQK